MAILKIARMGHPLLRRPAEEVADPTARDIAVLVSDMFETMVDANGLGLAAPQVHVSQRVVIFRTPGISEDDADDTAWSGLTVLINPVIDPIGEAREEGWEGCLSVPGMRGLVSRHCRVRYRGTAPDGSLVDREVEGLHARVVQHECDHLDGILYPMRMTDLSNLIFDSEFRHYRAAATDATDATDAADAADEEAEAIFASRISPLQLVSEVSGRSGFYVNMAGKPLEALIIEWEPTSAFGKYTSYEMFVYYDGIEPLFRSRLDGSLFSDPQVTSHVIANAGNRREKLKYVFVYFVPEEGGASREVAITKLGARVGE